jgi:hypothetical protein
MTEKDRKRLAELGAKERAGTLTYLERIELELMLEEDGKATEPEMEAGAWEDIGDEEEKVEPKVIAGPRPAAPPAGERMDEFEVVPVEEVEEEDEGPPPKRPAVTDQAGPEQKKMAAAFGAGAIVGYFLRELLEDEEGTGEDEDAGPEEGADD